MGKWDKANGYHIRLMGTIFGFYLWEERGQASDALRQGTIFFSCIYLLPMDSILYILVGKFWFRGVFVYDFGGFWNDECYWMGIRYLCVIYSGFFGTLIDAWKYIYFFSEK